MVSELDARRNQEDEEETQINTNDSSSSDYLSSSSTNSSNDESSIMSRKKKDENDVLTMRNSDHTGVIICTTIFNGGNYIGLSSGMRLALEAKSKLGFIDGSLVVPKESEVFDKWRKMDCLVRSWILNTVSDEIKSNYSSTTTTLDLWLDIKERYQENNGSQAYQIQKAISNLRQGTLSLEKYFSRIKKLYDELMVLEPLPSCDCDLRTVCCCRMTKLVVQVDTSNKLTQFLMGLNEYFDN
ncbi:uncharacterized protein LOC124918317 [Impatiens glandulifera]|uniref:uncharacterized protein LOC124918317 n=1 Tax=Impatiens glandulifera TaxID=253017 RepID=UPI001FB192AD|nr:uncharacterized protein LOC124918317 [Impatiens glandulifera]